MPSFYATNNPHESKACSQGLSFINCNQVLYLFASFVSLFVREFVRSFVWLIGLFVRFVGWFVNLLILLELLSSIFSVVLLNYAIEDGTCC